jgi:hypothetical protein
MMTSLSREQSKELKALRESSEQDKVLWKEHTELVVRAVETLLESS